MFCTNCGEPLPEGGVKFCPNCGIRLTSSVDIPIPVSASEEIPVDIPAPEAESTETLQEAIDAFETAGPEQPDEMMGETVEPFEAASAQTHTWTFEPDVPAESMEEPVVEPTAPSAADSPVSPVEPDTDTKKGLHFTATLSIVLTAVTVLFGTVALLGLLVNMHPGIIILFSTLNILTAPLPFGFGLAAFVVGLKQKHPATWIIGLVAALLALLHVLFGVVCLILGIFVAVL